jgi:hypothetical protein
VYPRIILFPLRFPLLGLVRKVCLNDRIYENLFDRFTLSEDFGFKPAARREAEAAYAARKDKPDFVDYEFIDWKGHYFLQLYWLKTLEANLFKM